MTSHSSCTRDLSDLVFRIDYSLYQLSCFNELVSWRIVSRSKIFEQSNKQNACQQTLQAIQSATVSAEQGLHTKNLLNGSNLQQTPFLQYLMHSHQQLVHDIHQLRDLLRVQTEMPPQVKLQRPVILLDACGKLAPFHLEFVTSEEAFLTVLKIRFRQAGVRPGGVQKLERSEYVLRGRKRMVSRTRPWEQRFQPGQKYDMRMTFRWNVPQSTCPSCQTETARLDWDSSRARGRLWRISARRCRGRPSDRFPAVTDHQFRNCFLGAERSVLHMRSGCQQLLERSHLLRRLQRTRSSALLRCPNKTQRLMVLSKMSAASNTNTQS